MQTTMEAPASVDALAWAAEILGPLRRVALDFQLAAAREIRAEREHYQGTMVEPVGPSLAALREMAGTGKGGAR